MPLRSVPLAELVILMTLFFGIVCADATMEIGDRVLFQDDSIAGAVARLDSEYRLRERLKGSGLRAPLPPGDDPWSLEASPLADVERARRLGIGFSEIPPESRREEAMILATP